MADQVAKAKAHCLQCGVEFVALPSEINRGKDKFCSRPCVFAYRRTRPLVACAICGKPFPRKSAKHRFCSRPCFNEATTRGNIKYGPKCGWAPSKYSSGYCLVHLETTNFFFPMADQGGYVPEHRLAMAQHLGRNLQRWELVHHKNGIKDDNRLENLEIVSRPDHIQAHGKGYQDGYTKGLLDGRTKQIEELRQEIKLLQWQIKEMTNVSNQKPSSL